MDLILDDSGLGKEINEMVERVFCRLSGREMPLYPVSTSGGQQQEEKEQNENEGGLGSKKRIYNEMAQGPENTANGSAHLPAAS